MSPALRIPPRYRPGLVALNGLSEPQVERLHAALEQPADRLASERLTATVRAAVPELADVAEDVIDGLSSLVSLLSDEDDDQAVGELARDVSESPDLDLPLEGRSGFAESVRRLMLLPAVSLAAHAQDLASEHERGFHDARILTDIKTRVLGWR